MWMCGCVMCNKKLTVRCIAGGVYKKNMHGGHCRWFGTSIIKVGLVTGSSMSMRLKVCDRERERESEKQENERQRHGVVCLLSLVKFTTFFWPSYQEGH